MCTIPLLFFSVLIQTLLFLVNHLMSNTVCYIQYVLFDNQMLIFDIHGEVEDFITGVLRLEI